MKVLIIEDDPMVDFIHRNYLEKTNLFDSIISSDALSDALTQLEHYAFDLILLDIHIKDGTGIHLLEIIRAQHHNCEVIVISAANDGQTIKRAFHLGVVDYLIKPFTFDRFQESIKRFLEVKNQLNQQRIQQQQIDQLNAPQVTTTSSHAILLEKGLSEATFNFILKTIQDLNQAFTIQELADITQLSHVSIRKYIAFLEDNHYLNSEQIYVKVGRPYRVYRLR